MSSSSTAPARSATAHAILAGFLLWLAGNALRLTILAVPPILALVRDDFSLSATEVAILSSIPPALFAVASLAGSLLVARLGLLHALLGGLLITAAGSALRGATGSFAALLAATIVMSAGVAMLQPIMPAIVRAWLPRRIGLGTALYTNGLLVGEVFPTLFTIALVLPLMGGSWRGSLVFWSAPIAAIALVVWWLAPREAPAPRAPDTVPGKWLPDWHKGLVWRLGALFCCINGIYFSANAFLPIYLASKGRPDLIGGALAALNFGQIPASLLLLAAADRLQRKTWPYLVSGAISLAAILGLVFDVGARTLWWAAALGFSDAGALILALMLPPLLCKPEDVARTAAGTFTLSYGGAVAIAIVGGIAWDTTGIPAMSFAPLAAGALALAGLALLLRARRELV
ncbi:MAG: MFS transporter [Burkholderiales bacterium]|nr:MFS transporter [Burkholderiales bacterium]